MRLHLDGPFRGLWRHGYGLIYCDPPWRHVTWGETNAKAPPYQTMSEQELIDLDVNSLAMPDCHLAMWTTHPHLAQSIRLMKAWGFVYSTVLFTWVKLNSSGTPWRGMGKTTRKNTEIVLLGRHGSPKRFDGNLDELIFAKRMEHSRKPEEARRRLERYVGPETRKVELFARRSDVGSVWHFHGNQVSMYDGYPIDQPSDVPNLLHQQAPNT